MKRTPEEYGIYEDPHRKRSVRRKETRLKRSFLSPLIALIICFALFQIARGQWELYQANLRLEDMRQELRDAERLRQELTERLEHVESDEYVEYRARRELGMVREGETVIVLQDDPEDAAK